MTPHDLELRLYNDIIEDIAEIEINLSALLTLTKLNEKDSAYAIKAFAIAIDVKDKFTKYTNRHYES